MNNNDVFEEEVYANPFGLAPETVRTILLATLVLSNGGELKIPMDFVISATDRLKDLSIEADETEWVLKATTDEEKEN